MELVRLGNMFGTGLKSDVSGGNMRGFVAVHGWKFLVFVVVTVFIDKGSGCERSRYNEHGLSSRRAFLYVLEATSRGTDLKRIDREPVPIHCHYPLSRCSENGLLCGEILVYQSSKVVTNNLIRVEGPCRKHSKSCLWVANCGCSNIKATGRGIYRSKEIYICAMQLLLMHR